MLQAVVVFPHAAKPHQYKPNAVHWKSRSSLQGWQDLGRRMFQPERRSNEVLPQLHWRAECRNQGKTGGACDCHCLPHSRSRSFFLWPWTLSCESKRRPFRCPHPSIGNRGTSTLAWWLAVPCFPSELRRKGTCLSLSSVSPSRDWEFTAQRATLVGRPSTW